MFSFFFILNKGFCASRSAEFWPVFLDSNKVFEFGISGSSEDDDNESSSTKIGSFAFPLGCGFDGEVNSDEDWELFVIFFWIELMMFMKYGPPLFAGDDWLEGAAREKEGESGLGWGGGSLLPTICWRSGSESEESSSEEETLIRQCEGCFLAELLAEVVGDGLSQELLLLLADAGDVGAGWDGETTGDCSCGEFGGA